MENFIISNKDMNRDNKVSNVIGAIKEKRKKICHKYCIKWKLKFVGAKQNSYGKKLRYMTMRLSKKPQTEWVF